MKGIYFILSKENNKTYIGQSENIERRFKEHKSKLKNNNHCNKYLQNSFNKYGYDSFEFSVLCEIESKEKRDEMEIKFIEFFKSANKRFGFNISKGGDGVSGYFHSQETLEKMKKSRSKIQGAHFLGKKHSPETILKIKECALKRGKRKPMSEESRKKISNALKGKKSKNPSKIITQKNIDEIKKLTEEGFSLRQIKDIMNIGLHSISKMRKM